MPRSFTVFRIAKLKSFGNIAGASAHNLRTRPTPNADPSRENIVLFGPRNPDDVVGLVKQKLENLTVRKNAVLAVEAIISASPEYFRPDDPGRAGHWDSEKLLAWRKAVEPWIRQKFPHAVSVVLHLDEATPHYQIIDVPINDLTGRLDARTKYGGRAVLAGWQTDAAKSVAHLGIERGVPGSKAEHQKVKKFYNTVNQDPVPVPDVMSKPKPLPDATFSERIPGTKSSKERSEKEKKHNQRMKKWQTQRTEARRTRLRNYPILESKAKAAMFFEQREKTQTKNYELLHERTKEQEKEIQQLRAQANQLRALPLSDVLTRMYGAKLSAGSKESHKSREYHLSDGRKVAVSPARTGGEVWIEQGSSKGQKGAINLVMYLDDCDYKTAVQSLANNFGSETIVREHSATVVEQAQREVKKIISEPAQAPEPHPSTWPRVQKWLQTTRAIPSKLVDWLHNKGLVYSDVRNNAVFPRVNGGAFMRGTTPAPFFRTVGGKTSGPYIIPNDPKSNEVILCEAPVDALSLKAIHPGAKIIAMGGNLLSFDDVKSHVPDGAQIKLGFDNDDQGRAFTEQARMTWPSAEVLALPRGCGDWNDALREKKAEINSSWKSSEPLENRTSQRNEQRFTFGSKPR